MPKLVRYLYGYLRRPYLWHDLLRQPWRMILLRLPRERSRMQAAKWAKERAVTTVEAIEALTDEDAVKYRFSEYHGEAIDHAKKRQQSFPVRVGGAGNIDLIFALARWLNPKVVVETGVAAGWSTLAILLALKDNHCNGRLISVDRPDMKFSDDRYIGGILPEELREHWTLLLGADRDKLPKALEMAGKSLSLVHYDSDKSYYGRSWAYELIWTHLPPGGLLVSDDIGDNMAFRDFCANRLVSPLVVSSDEKFVGIAMKDH